MEEREEKEEEEEEEEEEEAREVGVDGEGPGEGDQRKKEEDGEIWRLQRDSSRGEEEACGSDEQHSRKDAELSGRLRRIEDR